MLKVLFFAKLREDLKCSELSLQVSAPITSRKALIQAIAVHVDGVGGNDAGQAFIDKLSAENIVMAVNHQVCKSDIAMVLGDEIAFYPPVTGG